MRKQYSLWQKLLRRKQPHLTPEEILTSKDRMQIMQIVLVTGAILLNVLIVASITMLN